MNLIIENNKYKINELCKSHHVKKLFAFGSVTRNDFNDNSDIDLIYEFDTSGIDFKDINNAEYDYVDNLISFEEALRKLFNKNVDLLPDKEITNKYLKKFIEQDKTLIFADEEPAEVS